MLSKEKPGFKYTVGHYSGVSFAQGIFAFARPGLAAALGAVWVGWIASRGMTGMREGTNKRDWIVPIGTRPVKAIKRYLTYSRPRQTHDKSTAALFLSQYETRLSRGTVAYIVGVYAKKMRKRITPHTLRHSFATHLLANGADIAIILRLLGHSRIKSTEVYTRVAKPELKNEVRKRHPRAKHKSGRVPRRPVFS